MNIRYRFDFILLIAIYFCIVVGILTLYSQEIVLQEAPGRWSRQLIYACLGSIFLFVLQKLNYQNFSAHAVYLYAASILLLLITLIPGIGSEINGARSWIRLGSGFGFQASELAKLSTIIFLASYLALKEREMQQLSSLIFPFIITMIPVILIVVQPDFGSAFSLLPILLALFILAGADIYHIGSIMVFVGLSLAIPLYVEYHNIILLPHLQQHLEELAKTDILPAVRILKTNIWAYVNDLAIPVNVAKQDHAYLTRVLQNKNLIASLQDAAAIVRHANGGLLLIFLDKLRLLVSIGTLMLFIALSLFAFRLARGVIYAGMRRLYIPLGIIGISLITAATVQSVFSFRPHQIARITAFISPEKFPRDLAYQIRASKAAIGSGKFGGRGLWQGEMTIGHRPLVPEAYTDFIFTSWAERTGFIGAFFLILALIAIPLRGLLLSSEARDRFGSLLAGGISFLFLFHIAMNIGIGLGLLPVTGLPLSFVSYGGSHLVVSMAAVGLLMSIYRRKFAH